MTDIVERLRKGVDNDGYHHLIDATEEIMHEAADEIERLRNKEKNQMNYLLLKMAEMTDKIPAAVTA